MTLEDYIDVHRVHPLSVDTLTSKPGETEIAGRYLNAYGLLFPEPETWAKFGATEEQIDTFVRASLASVWDRTARVLGSGVPRVPR
jgi:hypothetical protein